MLYPLLYIHCMGYIDYITYSHSYLQHVGLSKTWSTENPVANHHPQLFRHKLGSSLFLNTAMFPKPHYSSVSSGIQHFSLGQAVYVSVQSVFLLVKIAVLLGLYGLKPIWSIFLWAVLPCCKNQICSSCFWLKSQCFCFVLSQRVLFQSQGLRYTVLFLCGLDILFSWEKNWMQCVYLAFFCFVLSSWFQSHVSWQQSVLLLVSSHLFILDPCSSLFFPGIESQQKSWVNIQNIRNLWFFIGFPMFFSDFDGFFHVFPPIPAWHCPLRCIRPAAATPCGTSSWPPWAAGDPSCGVVRSTVGLGDIQIVNIVNIRRY